MVLTTAQLRDIDVVEDKCGLTHFPKSKYWLVGHDFLRNGMHIETEKRRELAIDSFKRGAEMDGCVSCILFFCQSQYGSNNLLSLPWVIECAIRGHIRSIMKLVVFYTESKPVRACALSSLWEKMAIELGSTESSEEYRKRNKTNLANICFVCGKKDSENITLVKCGICKHYSYCGKDHIAECRQVMILRKYFKPRYAQEIREAIVRGDDPATIERLQTLRTMLGLSRPKEEYEELLLILGDDNTNDTSQSPNRYEYLVGRKDGTVHIGSTPNDI